MTATATHDTKRGEDARARLLALSEMPEAWAAAVERFDALTEPLLVDLDEVRAPDANDRYLLLQSLLGAWPNELLGGAPDPAAIEGFRERIAGYAARPCAKPSVTRAGSNVGEAYEEATAAIIRALLSPDSAFLREFEPLARRLAHAGMVTGLARTVLKCTLPAFPTSIRARSSGTCRWSTPTIGGRWTMPPAPPRSRTAAISRRCCAAGPTDASSSR